MCGAKAGGDLYWTNLVGVLCITLVVIWANFSYKAYGLGD